MDRKKRGKNNTGEKREIDVEKEEWKNWGTGTVDM
jgi:hypothetical protein